jgi:hypothetical protein
LAAATLVAQPPRRPGGPGGGQGGGGGGGQQGAQDDDEDKGGGGRGRQGKLPEDQKLLDALKKYILEADKVATEYERTGQLDKAKACYEEMLRVVPSFEDAKAKLDKIKGKELTAEKRTMLIQSNKGWQDTNIDCVAGKPVAILADGAWTFRLTKEVTADGIEIPKELRDFPLGALVGVIRNGSSTEEPKPFLVGSKSEFMPKQSGRLWLCVYDNDPTDNQGRLNVTISGTFASTLSKK